MSQKNSAVDKEEEVRDFKEFLLRGNLVDMAGS